MAVRSGDADPDFSKSTNAFPMDREPAVILSDGGIDYSKSTGAFPMYDDRNARQRTVEHIGAEVHPGFITPGPQSTGAVDSVVVTQRKSLGLSADPTGESDAGYEARPTTVVVPGADGVEREVTTSHTKVVDGNEVVAKVVEPAVVDKAHGRTRATGK